MICAGLRLLFVVETNGMFVDGFFPPLSIAVEANGVHVVDLLSAPLEVPV